MCLTVGEAPSVQGVLTSNRNFFADIVSQVCKAEIGQIDLHSFNEPMNS